jgi:hypothetical protein
VFETHNVVCKTELPPHVWQFVYRMLERMSSMERNALLAAFTFNSLFITHFLPALEDLLRIQNAIQGFPVYEPDIAGQQTMTVVADGGGLLRAYNMVPAPGGAVGFDRARNDFQMETGYVSRCVQTTIAGFFGAANPNIAIRLPSVTQLMVQFKATSRDIHTEYKARRAPFTAPRFWLVHDPLVPLVPPLAPALPPWIRVDPRRDVVNGVLIQMPVAVGALPVPAAVDLAHIDIIRHHHLAEI